MIRVRVRDVEVRTDADLTLKQIRSLLRTVACVAAAFEEPEAEKPVMGFSAQVERLPEDFSPTEYDDED